MRRNPDEIKIPAAGEGTLVFTHHADYDPKYEGKHSFSSGTYGQVKYVIDVPKETRSMEIAGFEARAKIKKLHLDGWTYKVVR